MLTHSLRTLSVSAAAVHFPHFLAGGSLGGRATPESFAPRARKVDEGERGGLMSAATDEDQSLSGLWDAFTPLSVAQGSMACGASSCYSLRINCATLSGSRGTVPPNQTLLLKVRSSSDADIGLQEYFAHKKQRPLHSPSMPRSLWQSWGGWAVSHE